MASLPAKTGHLTGLYGRGSGTVPVPARAEAHASSSGAAPRAASAPAAVRFRKDLRVSFLGTPWPCQPSLGCIIGLVPGSRGCGAYGSGEDGEVLDEAVDVRLVVLHRDEPLLDLAPGRQEDPAVVLVEPVRVTVPVVHAEEAAVVLYGLGGEYHAALGARGDHVRGQPVVLDGLLYAAGGPLAERLDLLVCPGRGHLGEHGPGRGHGQRVPVEGADHLIAAGGHVTHDVGGAADGRDGHAAAQRLGQGDEVGLDVFLLRHAARADGQAGLHLVEGEQGMVFVQEGLEGFEVAGPWLDDAGVHHDRLDDHPRDLVPVLVEKPGHAVEVVEGGDQRQIGDGPGNAGGGGGAVGLVSRPGYARLRGHRDLHRVVMTVIAALDLDDQVPAGDRAHEVDGVHGGFGAGVGETPFRQAEAARELPRDHDGVRGGLGEVGAQAGLACYCFRDGRVGVAGQGGAVAAVQVDVLIAVDVPDLRTAAVAQPDRLRHGDLPARGDTAGEVVLGLLGQTLGARLAADEDLLLRRDDLPELGVTELGVTELSVTELGVGGHDDSRA